jgi:S1-C subfamily serine protease
MFQDIFIAVITAYLSFTSSLALQIESWMPSQTPSQTAQEFALEPAIVDLPSVTGKNVPDILLTNADYQAATLAGSVGLTGSTVNDPLEAVVNVFCTLTTDTTIRTTTGTGFFIDPDGVIMTNAHVAQFLLLEETSDLGEATCVIRGGNPATPQYEAEILYLSPAWIQNNATVLSDESHMGTGERDYALLYVSDSINGEPLPAVFPALSYNTDLLPLSTRGKEVRAAGYPAGPLLQDGPSANLIPQQATTTVSELYTFGSNFADVFSIRGSIVGTEGSSGGPVLNDRGEVIGVIVTRGDDTIDGSGSLRAITLAHIEQTIQEETGFDLTQNLSGNLPFRSSLFTDTMSPFLLQILQLNN